MNRIMLTLIRNSEHSGNYNNTPHSGPDVRIDLNGDDAGDLLHRAYRAAYDDLAASGDIEDPLVAFTERLKEAATHPLMILSSAPVIPAKVCEVEDRDGDRWKPCGTDTWRMDSADGTATYIQTGDLIAQCGPLIHIMKVSANGCVNIDPREVDGGAPE